MGNGADDRLTNRTKFAEAKAKGYEGEPCNECGNFTLMRNGTQMKCDTCGAITGSSNPEHDRPGFEPLRGQRDDWYRRK